MAERAELGQYDANPPARLYVLQGRSTAGPSH